MILKCKKIDFIYKKRFQYIYIYIYIITDSIFITTKLIKTKKKSKSSEIHNQTRFYTILPFNLTKIYKSHSKIIKST